MIWLNADIRNFPYPDLGQEVRVMPKLIIRTLAQSELELAWPLLRGRSSATSASSWRRLAERLLRRGGGIVGVTAEDGLLHGVATFEPVAKAQSPRVLRVDTLVTFELNRAAPVRAALRAALDGFARSLHCEKVLVTGLVEPRAATARGRKIPSGPAG